MNEKKLGKRLTESANLHRWTRSSTGRKTKCLFAAGFDSLYGTARQINDCMIAEGIGGQQRDGSQLLDGSVLRAL
jgi:hypothetical protein